MPAATTPVIPRPQPATRRTAHVAIVLDRSGSMESCRDATIGGFNEYAQQIRATAADTLDARLTLTVFNHEIRMPLFEEPLDTLRPLSRATYVPHGTTAMLDAVGRTIDRLERRCAHDRDVTFLVCVISDGYENASREYSYADIAEWIQRLTATERWTFTYLGSNQDLSKVSADLHIPQGNIAGYDAACTPSAWRRHTRATERHLRGIHQAAPAATDFYRDSDGS